MSVSSPRVSKGSRQKPDSYGGCINLNESMPKKLKEIPKFKNEDEEREFWAKNDSANFIDWEKAETETLPKLKPDRNETKDEI